MLTEIALLAGYQLEDSGWIAAEHSLRGTDGEAVNDEKLHRG